MRTAFVMKLLPGCEKEYKKRHNEIWPELVELLARYGISDYEIWLDPESLQLFAIHSIDEESYNAEKLIAEPILRKWWHSMEDIMETNEDESPVSLPLKKMFRME